VETTFAAPATSTDGQVISNIPVAAPVSVAPVVGASSYLWYMVASGGTSIAGVTSNSYSPVVSATQTFYVAATNGICISDRKSVTAFVYPEPIITATNGGTIPRGGSVTLSVANFPYSTYQWRLNDTAIDGAVNSTLTTTNSGNFTVVVTYGTAVKTSKVFRVYKGLEGQNMNYIVNNTVRVEGVVDKDVVGSLDVDQLEQSTQYFDDLGRPIQTVVTQGSPMGNDIVQPVVYDEFGREKRKYLPIVVESKDGRYKPGIIDGGGSYTGIAASFYATPGGPIAADEKPYAETIFENSPLNRPLQQFGAGKSWYDNNKSIGYQYLVNVYGTAAGQEKIVAYQMDENGMLAKEPPFTGNVETGGYYSSNQLLIKCTVDEQGNTVREYTNKEEKVVLKKVQVVAGSTDLNNVNEWAFTYYVYDDLNNLVIVVPPEAVRILGN
jgi:hypothetical protein